MMTFQGIYIDFDVDQTDLGRIIFHSFLTNSHGGISTVFLITKCLIVN